MKLFFEFIEPGKEIEIADPFYLWHRDHGWLYRVWRVDPDRAFGFFAVTRLPADAGMLHFTGWRSFSAAECRAAMKKGIALMESVLSQIYTVADSPGPMDRVLPHFGFKIVDRYARGCDRLAVWKHFSKKKTML